MQVITGNRSNCVTMGHMLEDEFPTIVWTPCTSHSLNLLIEDIEKDTMGRWGFRNCSKHGEVFEEEA